MILIPSFLLLLKICFLFFDYILNLALVSLDIFSQFIPTSFPTCLLFVFTSLGCVSLGITGLYLPLLIYDFAMFSHLVLKFSGLSSSRVLLSHLLSWILNDFLFSAYVYLKKLKGKMKNGFKGSTSRHHHNLC